MKAVKLVVVFALALGAFCSLGFAEVGEDTAKQKDIRALMEASGELNNMRQAMLGMINSMRQTTPDAPAGFWDEFAKAVMTDELPSLLVPVYDRHFTHDQIRELITFWKSPTGRMLAEKQPLLQQDAMSVGEHWGQKVSMEIVSKLMGSGDTAAEGATADEGE